MSPNINNEFHSYWSQFVWPNSIQKVDVLYFELPNLFILLALNQLIGCLDVITICASNLL